MSGVTWQDIVRITLRVAPPVPDWVNLQIGQQVAVRFAPTIIVGIACGVLFRTASRTTLGTVPG